MNRMRTLFVLCLFAVSCQFNGAQFNGVTPIQADDDVGAGPRNVGDAPVSEARRAATEKRREWIRKHLTAELPDQNQVARLNAQLDALDDQQVDAAAARLLEQLDKRQGREDLSRAVNDLARAREAREAMRGKAAARAAATAPPVGFFPLITVLPEGASMTASAVVSPDRRHVRISVNPFFSTIGPVDTFNFYTGETRRLREFHPQDREPAAVAPRYDGSRTHNDRNRRR